MKKEDIQFEVAELIEIRDRLKNAQKQSEINGCIVQLVGQMNDLLSEAQYAEAAEDILQVIDEYNDHHMTRSDILTHVSTLINAMQEDMNKTTPAEQIKVVCDEIKSVCNDAVEIIRQEAQKACADIDNAMKREMPKCSGAIAAFKGAPKKMERKLKRGIKKWLESDD